MTDTLPDVRATHPASLLVTPIGTCRRLTPDDVEVPQDPSERAQLIDDFTEVVRRQEMEDFVVEMDDTLRHSGVTALPVALRHPHDPALAIGVATITNGALSAFTTTTAASAIWVVAAEAATAAALSRTLCDSEPHYLSRYFDFSYVRLFHDGRAEISRNFPGALFRQH
jgi:thiamine biosynthesis lipoprotein